jgi:hypothetical protein
MDGLAESVERWLPLRYRMSHECYACRRDNEVHIGNDIISTAGPRNRAAKPRLESHRLVLWLLESLGLVVTYGSWKVFASCCDVLETTTAYSRRRQI